MILKAIFSKLKIQANIKIGKEMLEQVNTKYLGQILTPDGNNENDIKATMKLYFQTFFYA